MAKIFKFFKCHSKETTLNKGSLTFSYIVDSDPQLYYDLYERACQETDRLYIKPMAATQLAFAVTTDQSFAQLIFTDNGEACGFFIINAVGNNEARVSQLYLTEEHYCQMDKLMSAIKQTMKKAGKTAGTFCPFSELFSRKGLKGLKLISDEETKTPKYLFKENI